MKEKIKKIFKIVLGVLITVFLLTLIFKEVIYLAAYKDCFEFFGSLPENTKTWRCIGILNGASQ